MKTVKRFGVLSAAKIHGVTTFLIILILVDPILLLIGLIGGLSIPGHGGAGAALGMVTVLIMCVAMPIIYGVIGFIVGALSAFVYNFVAGRIGGLEVEID